MQYSEMTVAELATQLILKRQEAKALEQYTKEIQDELLNRDFEKEVIEWITVSRKQRKNISLLPDADMWKIKSLYPDLVEVKNVLDMKKVDDELLAFIQEKSPEAIKEECNVDAKLLHECTKEFTTQKVTTYIEVK